MAMDPRQNVRPGDKLRIAAEQVNFLNGLMRQDTGFKSGPLEGYEPGKNIILARNNTGGDVPRWGVMAIGGIEINPATDDARRRSFEEMPCITGTTPSSTTGSKFVVAVEPIKSGKVGRVCAAGITQAKVEFWDITHTRAKPKVSDPFGDNISALVSADHGPASIIWASGNSGVHWALIRFDDSNTLRVGKYRGTPVWTKHSTAIVEIWEAGTPPNETATPGSQGLLNKEIVGVVNHWGDVAPGSWVGIQAAANGYYYLVVAEC